MTREAFWMLSRVGLTSQVHLLVSSTPGCRTIDSSNGLQTYDEHHQFLSPKFAGLGNISKLTSSAQPFRIRLYATWSSYNLWMPTNWQILTTALSAGFLTG